MNVITLTPEELFVMARIMKAKYLDYDYVSMMGDISQDRQMIEVKAMTMLNEKGLIFEDFFGDFEVLDLANELLTPIFFGKFESEYYLNTFMEDQHFKFHKHNDTYVQVQIIEKELIISKVTKEDMATLVPICESLDKREVLPINYFEDKTPDGVLILRNLHIGKKATNIQMIQMDGIFYRERYGSVYSVSKTDLQKLITKTITEN